MPVANKTNNLNRIQRTADLKCNRIKTALGIFKYYYNVDLYNFTSVRVKKGISSLCFYYQLKSLSKNECRIIQINQRIEYISKAC